MTRVGVTYIIVRRVMSLKIKSRRKILAGIGLSILVVAGCKNLTYITNRASATEVSTPIYHSLSEITYMQEMTASVCNASRPNESKQLIDRRDQKTYWVTKLADGNCWMTQNLDLDLGIKDEANNIDTTKLNPEDSDIATEWNMTTSTYPITQTSTGDINGGRWKTEQTVVQSWDPGDYVYVGAGLGLASCGTDYGNLGVCDQTVWKLVDNEHEHDNHYLIGNYYSWNAATAGTGGVMSSGVATGSICPKGWKLPTVNYSDAGNDYASLLTAEGVDNIDAVRLAPLYFVPSGDIYEGGGRWAGSAGILWSSRARNESTTNAYRFMYNQSGIHATSDGTTAYNQTYRYLGNTVRCVADMDNFPVGEETKVNNPHITVVVNPTITIDLSTSSIEIEADATKVATGEFDAIVTTNQSYSISLKASDRATTALSNTEINETIPALGAGEKLIIGKNAWGLRVCGATEMDCKTVNNTDRYTGLTSGATEYYRSEAGATEGVTSFQVGVTISPTLPAGEYSTTMTVTAATI